MHRSPVSFPFLTLAVFCRENLLCPGRLEYNMQVLGITAIYLIRRFRGDNLDVKKGEDAIQTMKVLGQNMGWLIKKLN